MKQSLTITSLALLIGLNVLTGFFGVEISDANFTQWIETGGTIVLGMVAWYGRKRAGGINWFGRRT